MLYESFKKAETDRLLLYPQNRTQKNALLRRVKLGKAICPLTGLYAFSDSWEKLSRREKMLRILRTEARLHQSWVFTHATAAIVHGLEVSNSLYWPINYTTDRLGGGEHFAKHKHHRVSYNAFTEVDDIRVADVLQTVIECARCYEFGKALAIADSALHKGLITKDDLVYGTKWFAGKRGIRAARRVAELASPLPQSGGESIVRALMIELGLPEPELQAPVPSIEDPKLVYHVDFMFRPSGLAPVALELDGLEKYQNIEMTRGKSAVRLMAEERQREASITASGIRVARLGFAQATNPQVLLERLAAYGVRPVAD